MESKVVNQHTELEHTFGTHLYQQAKKAGIPFIIGERGIAERVCPGGVLQFSWKGLLIGACRTWLNPGNSLTVDKYSTLFIFMKGTNI